MFPRNRAAASFRAADRSRRADQRRGRVRGCQLLGAARRSVRRRRHRRGGPDRARAGNCRRGPNCRRPREDHGDVIRLAGPRDALDHGLVLVPEDRKAQGLILPQTIAENLALGNYRARRAVRLDHRHPNPAIRREGDHPVPHQGDRIDAGQRAFRRQPAEGRHRQEHSARAENRHSRRADPRHRRRRARRDLRHRRRPRRAMAWRSSS